MENLKAAERGSATALEMVRAKETNWEQRLVLKMGRLKEQQ